MSKRDEFTIAVKDLIAFMQSEGEKPILDSCLRSKEEQKRLFDKKLSKCDGEVIKSKHQTGLAIDIYFLTDDDQWRDLSKATYIKFHEFWKDLGGQVMIAWDAGHYEF